MEGAISRTNLWSQSVPRVELGQRSREARLRLERIERQPLPVYCSNAFPAQAISYGGKSRESRIRGPLNDRDPSCVKARRITR